MKKKLSGLDKSLIFVAIIVVLFTISMIATFWFKGDVPNVLITAVFGATFAECGFCSYIWKHKISKEQKEEEQINESGVNKNSTGYIDLGDGFSIVANTEKVSSE